MIAATATAMALEVTVMAVAGTADARLAHGQPRRSRAIVIA